MRSDELAGLRPLFEPGGAMEFWGPIFQAQLIVDANVVLADIRWLALKRKSATVRTALSEAIAGGTVVAHAPTYLREEIERKLPGFCDAERIDEAEANRLWDVYQRQLIFIDVGGPDASAHDPKDAPYLRLQEHLDAHILSKDKDIQLMGGRVLPVTVTMRLRDYSRAAVVEFSFKALGIMGTHLGLIFVKHAATRAAQTLSRVPTPAWYFAVAIAVWVLSDDDRRRSIIDAARPLLGKSVDACVALVGILQPVFAAYQCARTDSRDEIKYLTDVIASD